MTRRLVPLKYIAGINERSLGETTDPDYRIRYVDIAAVGRGELVAQPQEMRFEDAPSRARRRVYPGDTIVSTVRTYLRSVWPVPDAVDDLIVSTGFAVLTPREVDPGYFSWWVRSDTFIEEVVARSVGVSYPAINPLELGELKVSLPSRFDQRAIASFLDAETARIDGLIANKHRMIDLIEEHWQAELREALRQLVTETVALRHIARVKRGQSPRPIDDPVYFDTAGTHGWVRIQDASKSDVYLHETTQRLSEIGRRKSVSVGAGTLLVSIAASVGQPIITAMDCCYHDGWVGLLDLQAMPEFVYLCLVLPETFGGLGQVGTQTNINSDIVGRVRIPALPIDRQRAFADEMFSRRERSRQTAQRLREQLTVIREHRQALITAAVTGELEVPEVAA